jgi:hypothetical protein
LSRVRSAELWNQLRALPWAEIRVAGRTSHPAATFASWGRPVEESCVIALQTHLRAAADEHGWPRALDAARADAMDRAWGELLVEHMAVVPAVAAEDGVWRFLGVVVVPDLCLWRFPGDANRVVSSDDHVLGRLWWRSWVLGPAHLRAAADEPLTDDELTALFRRKDLVANPVVAQAIARVVLGDGRRGRERLAMLKDLLVDVLRLTPSVNLDALTPSQLDDTLRALIDRRTG